MTRERGSGITPQRVVDLLTKEVSGKSMLAVSKATGIGLAAIGRYLKGVGEPTTKTLQKLAGYFNVSVGWLRGDIPWTHEMELETQTKILINALRSRMAKSTCFDRVEIFDMLTDGFCRECGSDRLPCYCTRDY